MKLDIKEINTESLIWTDGFDNWKKAKEFPELQNILIQSPTNKY